MCPNAELFNLGILRTTSYQCQPEVLSVAFGIFFASFCLSTDDTLMAIAKETGWHISGGLEITCARKLAQGCFQFSHAHTLLTIEHTLETSNKNSDSKRDI